MTKIVGILNLTPDSFSDGGEHAFSPEKQIDAMIRDGADVIDIGAESTRPNAKPLSLVEEKDRLLPMLEMIGEYKQKHPNILFSIDTRNPENAALAMEYGVDWINDVTGFLNPEMINVARKYNANCVFMHSLSVPADPKIVFPEGADVFHEVYTWAETKIKELNAAGLNKLIFDCGIGFGKTEEQSWVLIQRIAEFKRLGVPILVGHSRKSFLKRFTNKPAAERDPETHKISLFLANEGVDYIRVHKVTPI